MSETYTVCKDRSSVERDFHNTTPIYVRAKHPDYGWSTYNIAELDKPSLLSWLRSRGGDNPWAEDVVGILLGHGHLHGASNDA